MQNVFFTLISYNVLMSDNNKRGHDDRQQHHKPSGSNLAIIILMSVLVLVTALSLIYFEIQVRSLTNLNGDKTDYSRHYAFVGDKSSTFLSSVYSAAKKEGSANEDYVEFTGRDLTTSYSVHDLMKIAISSGVDGIIVNADDSDDMSESINNAVSAGIPVICIGTDSYGSSRESYVGISYYTLGQEYGKRIAELGREGNVDVMIVASPEEHTTGQNLVLSGLSDYLGSNVTNARYDIESQVLGDGGMFSTAEAVTDLFSGDELPDILVCLDETSTTSACQAVVDSNHVGDVSIFGYYVNDTILNAVSKQVISGTLTVSTEEIGKRAVDCLDEYIRNGFVTEYVSMDIESVTVDNVDEYESDSTVEGSSDKEAE